MSYDNWLEGSAGDERRTLTCNHCGARVEVWGWREHGKWSPREEPVVCPLCDQEMEDE